MAHRPKIESYLHRYLHFPMPPSVVICRWVISVSRNSLDGGRHFWRFDTATIGTRVLKFFTRVSLIIPQTAWGCCHAFKYTWASFKRLYWQRGGKASKIRFIIDLYSPFCQIHDSHDKEDFQSDHLEGRFACLRTTRQTWNNFKAAKRVAVKMNPSLINSDV